MPTAIPCSSNLARRTIASVDSMIRSGMDSDCDTPRVDTVRPPTCGGLFGEKDPAHAAHFFAANVPPRVLQPFSARATFAPL